jgi:hypothetical protein
MSNDILVRHEYDGLQSSLSDDGSTKCCAEEGKTRQSEADQADINKIIKRLDRDGILPLSAFTQREGAFLDVSEVPDFASAMQQVDKARDYFMSLPATSRAMFDNDPAKLLDAVRREDSLQLLVDAGVIPANEVRPAISVPVEGGAGAPSAAPSTDVK